MFCFCKHKQTQSPVAANVYPWKQMEFKQSLCKLNVSQSYMYMYWLDHDHPDTETRILHTCSITHACFYHTHVHACTHVFIALSTLYVHLGLDSSHSCTLVPAGGKDGVVGCGWPHTLKWSYELHSNFLVSRDFLVGRLKFFNHFC